MNDEHLILGVLAKFAYKVLLKKFCLYTISWIIILKMTNKPFQKFVSDEIEEKFRNIQKCQLCDNPFYREENVDVGNHYQLTAENR